MKCHESLCRLVILSGADKPKSEDGWRWQRCQAFCLRCVQRDTRVLRHSFSDQCPMFFADYLQVSCLNRCVIFTYIYVHIDCPGFALPTFTTSITVTFLTSDPGKLWQMSLQLFVNVLTESFKPPGKMLGSKVKQHSLLPVQGRSELAAVWIWKFLLALMVKVWKLVGWPCPFNLLLCGYLIEYDDNMKQDIICVRTWYL